MTTSILAAAALAAAPVAELAPVTVYASRTGSDAADIPASVQIFDARDIARSGASDLPDFLKKRAGMDVRGMGGNPLLATVALRGFGDNAFGRTKIVLDGEELNTIDMSAPNLTRIPLGSVGRVEVVRGPSPVLYGDGALAGVVNVLTDPDDGETRTEIAAKAGSQETFGLNLRTRGSLGEDDVSYAASYDYVRSGGYRDRSAYGIHTANALVRRAFANGASAGLKANYQNAFYELPGALSYAQWKRGRKTALNRDDWTRLWSAGVSAETKAELADGQWLRLDASYSRRYRHASMIGLDTEYTYDSVAVSPRYVNENALFGRGNTFTLGADLRYDRYVDDPRAGAAKRFARDRAALFALDEFALTETLSLVAGARAERIGNRWSRAGAARQRTGNDLMCDAELGLVYRPARSLKTYVKGTRFHRSAFCDELNYTADGAFLEPETGYSLDAGAEWRFLDGFALDVNVYGTSVKDEIFFDPVLPPFGFNRNSPAKTRRAGFDAGLSWTREKTADASIRYGFVHADFDGGAYSGRDIPFVPNHRLRLEGGIWPCEGLRIGAGCSYVGSQYPSGDFANASAKLKAYTLFDASVSFTPKNADAWTLCVSAENIFDRDYCDYAGVGYYYPACGRSVLVTVKYAF
jgi:iron complex outermembrane receptor protein